jgi:hypothetical protein
MQAFMEEKNIRWGEIISGLLIVISAVGLVISLWATLRDAIPYLPALIFMLGTGAFHAAGHYTLRKWDLRSISRAVLIIGTLLVPLNFLAAIALTGGGESSARDSIPLFVVAVVIGMTAYGVMTWYAGQSLLSYGRSLLLVAVLGTCAGQLLVNRLFTPATTDTAVILLLMVPLVAYLFAVVGSLRAARRWRHLSPNLAQPLLLILGISSFALLAPIGLLVSKAESPDAILAQLLPTVSLVGAAILASGLVLHVRTRSSRLAQLRTTGTAIAFSGGFCLLAAVAMAWPIPLLLLFVGLVNACLLAGMAWVARLPLLHVAAVACGGLAVVIGYHGLVGSYRGWIVDSPTALPESLLTGQTSAVLTGYFLFLLLGVSGLLRRRQATEDAAVNGTVVVLSSINGRLKHRCRVSAIVWW